MKPLPSCFVAYPSALAARAETIEPCQPLSFSAGGTSTQALHLCQTSGRRLPRRQERGAITTREDQFFIWPRLSGPAEMTGVMASVMYSNLAAAPSEGVGWDKPEYGLTRFVADCASLAGIDGIRYLSTRPGSGTNVVLLKNEDAMEYVQVLIVQKLVKPKSPWG